MVGRTLDWLSSVFLFFFLVETIINVELNCKRKPHSFTLCQCSCAVCL